MGRVGLADVERGKVKHMSKLSLHAPTNASPGYCKRSSSGVPDAGPQAGLMPCLPAGPTCTATPHTLQANPWIQIDLGAVVIVSKVTIVGKAAGAPLAPGVKAPTYTGRHTFTVRVGNKKLNPGAAVDKR